MAEMISSDSSIPLPRPRHHSVPSLAYIQFFNSQRDLEDLATEDSVRSGQTPNKPQSNIAADDMMKLKGNRSCKTTYEKEALSLLNCDLGFLSSEAFLTLKVPCNNKSIGCQFEGTVDDLITHERLCNHRSKQCDSPLCRNYFRPANRPSDYDTVCSLQCGLVNKVYHALQKNDSSLALLTFCGSFEPLKEELRHEIEAEIAQTQTNLVKEALELDNLEDERKAMVEEVYLRTINYHIGRWSPKTDCWSCCKNGDIYSMGCRELK